MLSGAEMWCQLFSEPSAGSDLAGLRTSASPTGDCWVLDGQKVWSSYAQLSDFGLCIARTDPFGYGARRWYRCGGRTGFACLLPRCPVLGKQSAQRSRHAAQDAGRLWPLVLGWSLSRRHGQFASSAQVPFRQVGGTWSGVPAFSRARFRRAQLICIAAATEASTRAPAPIKDAASSPRSSHGMEIRWSSE